jgi:hypothetical protein
MNACMLLQEQLPVLVLLLLLLLLLLQLLLLLLLLPHLKACHISSCLIQQLPICIATIVAGTTEKNMQKVSRMRSHYQQQQQQP